MLTVLAWAAGLYVIVGLLCSTFDRMTEEPGYYRTPIGSVYQFFLIVAVWPAWLAEALTIRM